MPPAARVTDMHVCPMVTGVVPHVGGPILPPGVPTVLIDFLPAATVTDMLTCVGPPDMIAMGSTGVFINFLPAARLGDMTEHGGAIVMGSPTCIIGEVGSPSPGAAGVGTLLTGLLLAFTDKKPALVSALSKGKGVGKAAVVPTLDEWRSARNASIKQAISDQNALLKARKADLEEWTPETKAEAVKWFGSDSETTRKTLLDRTNKEIELNEKLTVENFHPADPHEEGTFAYVHPDDPEHKIYLDTEFDKAPTDGENSKAGVLCHEMSHFEDIGGTDDHEYGAEKCLKLARTSPAKALANADSYEYFMESAKPPAPAPTSAVHLP